MIARALLYNRLTGKMLVLVVCRRSRLGVVSRSSEVEGGRIGLMVIVTDAYLAEHAEEQLDGGLYVEGDHLDRAQIGPDGKAVVALVVNFRRPLDDPDVSAINIELVYPWGGREPIPGLDIPPQQHVSESGFAFLDLGLDAPVEGRYELVVSGGGGEVTVPVELFK